jgi:protein-tyrosine phosphatase
LRARQGSDLDREPELTPGKMFGAFGFRMKKALEGVKPFGEKQAGEDGNVRMDMTWVTGRIAVGGGIWHEENMATVARVGITHVIDMQIEFDDTPLAAAHAIEVLWNPIDDDFLPKPPDVFQRGVDFAIEALDQPGTKLYIHCAAGVHRAPMMALALLCTLGWKVKDALRLIETRRPQVDFADVYVRSVERFLEGYAATRR